MLVIFHLESIIATASIMSVAFNNQRAYNSLSPYPRLSLDSPLIAPIADQACSLPPLVFSLALSIPFYLPQNRIHVYTIVKITSATSVTLGIVLMMFKERSDSEGRVVSILRYIF